MLNATNKLNKPPMNHPTNAPPPPVELKAAENEEIPPARIQMIENEIAKFENPPIRRESSWAYPSLCNTCLSCSLVSAMSYFSFCSRLTAKRKDGRSEEHTSELQSH